LTRRARATENLGMGGPLASLDEVRRLLAELPGPDLDAGTEAARHGVAVGTDALGRFGALASWLATWQAAHPPRTRHPRIAVFAANHGVAARLGLAPEATAARVARCIGGGAAVNQLCRTIDADLRVYEMGLDRPTTDFTIGATMEDGECARAMAYGMMAVEPGIDLLVAGEMGEGDEAAAAALAGLLFGGTAADWLGANADPRLIETVEAGLQLHRGAAGDPFDALRRVGGLEFAAVAGALMAARLARIPVLIDGFPATAAAAVVFAADRRGLDHCQAAQVSAAPGHARLLGALGKEPLLDLGLASGDGVAGALAVGLVQAAVACHAGMKGAA
jgi:nicotinate-nucleotide--dimethylbenzimidazole phosphoribosyltransferase